MYNDEESNKQARSENEVGSHDTSIRMQEKYQDSIHASVDSPDVIKFADVVEKGGVGEYVEPGFNYGNITGVV